MFPTTSGVRGGVPAIKITSPRSIASPPACNTPEFFGPVFASWLSHFHGLRARMVRCMPLRYVDPNRKRNWIYRADMRFGRTRAG